MTKHNSFLSAEEHKPSSAPLIKTQWTLRDVRFKRNGIKEKDVPKS